MGSFETPPPKQGISNPFRGMGGGGGYGYFLELHMYVIKVSSFDHCLCGW